MKWRVCCGPGIGAAAVILLSALHAAIALALGQGANGAEVAVAGPNLDVLVQEQADPALDNARGAVQVASASRAEGAGAVKAVGHARAPPLSQNRGQRGPVVNSLGNCDKLISLITELISHRPVRTFPISRIQRRGRHVHSTQCVHWCLVGVPILSQVTAVFTLASFAPAQSIDQGWRLSGAANPIGNTKYWR